MMADVAGPAAFQDFVVCAASVHIDRKKMAAIFSRPIISEINHHANMRMAPAVGIGLAVSGFGPTFRGVKVPMIGVLIDQSIGARVRIDGVGPDEVPAREIMPEMAVDSVDEEQLAMFI